MSSESVMFENSTRTYSQDLEELLMKQRDARTKDWFLAESLTPLFAILGVYLAFCIYVGPRIMRNRKPFELKNTLIVYNALQVVFSAVLVYEVSAAC